MQMQVQVLTHRKNTALVELRPSLLGGDLVSVNWPLTRKKQTIAGSSGFPNTEVLNCQQACESDFIKGS